MSPSTVQKPNSNVLENISPTDFYRRAAKAQEQCQSQETDVLTKLGEFRPRREFTTRIQKRAQSKKPFESQPKQVIGQQTLEDQGGDA